MNYIISLSEWRVIFDKVVEDFKNLTLVDINNDEVEQIITKYLIEQFSNQRKLKCEKCSDRISIDTLFTITDGEQFKRRSLLHLAIQCVHPKMVKLLIMIGMQVNICGDDRSLVTNPNASGFIHGDGWTPLHEAVVMDTYTKENSSAKKEIIGCLISSKADINRRYTANRRTPLHELCAKNNNNKDDEDILQILIKSGADPNLADFQNKTSYTIAYEKGYINFIEIFNSTKVRHTNSQFTNTKATAVRKEKYNNLAQCNSIWNL